MLLQSYCFKCTFCSKRNLGLAHAESSDGREHDTIMQLRKGPVTALSITRSCSSGDKPRAARQRHVRTVARRSGMSTSEVSEASKVPSSAVPDVLDEVPQASGSSQKGDKPDHILVMVNGLFGSTENWQVVQRNLAKVRQASKILMVASNANLKLQTFDGIDNCGKRLAKELQECIDANPSLAYVSVIGHSMGGLIARYTLGLLYDPGSGRVAGLKPRHFISMATPHLGCGGAGPAQVPFIGWTGDFPLVGSYATKALQYWTNSFATVVMRKTGEQFFLLDGKESSDPLLVQMVEDGTAGNFFSALEAFESRSCYANSSGDHIVGWANSSVRHPEELPDLGDITAAKGVVRQDHLRSAFAMPPGGQNGSHADRPKSSHGDSVAESGSVALRQQSNSGVSEALGRAESLEQAEKTMESSEAALRILRRLQTLPWCRIDTSFRGTTFPYFAHNLIQVTREWLNWEGESVVQHLAQHFGELEEALDCDQSAEAVATN